ncbi:FAD-dependent monooxygenase [Sporosarcina sp.]|uniref:FAD-dependent monooxygenase n=1 Tax=Sporosarcina sp. TaxID=49982 RepID=UPI00345BD12E
MCSKSCYDLLHSLSHVPARITASGFNASLQDAAALGKCAAKGLLGKSAVKALKKYESMRLKKVQRIVQSGQSFSSSFGRTLF